MVMCHGFVPVFPREIVIAGPRDHPSTRELLREIGRRWLPDAVLAGFDPGLAASDPAGLFTDGRWLMAFGCLPLP